MELVGRTDIITQRFINLFNIANRPLILLLPNKKSPTLKRHIRLQLQHL